ncbi:MAG: hypothetical protein KDK99_17090 [Verrucomicrobiales bacterium]|nr:hypothetical protein [Verrucomicrobiales bacterium]
MIQRLPSWAASWFRFEPIRHQLWERILIRASLALVIGWTLTGDSAFQTQAHPNGLARFMDLTFLSQDSVEVWLRPACKASLVLWVFGVPAVLSLLLPLTAGIGFITLKNSQGAIGHTFQVVHLCQLAIWLASAWSMIQHLRRRALPHHFSPAQLEIDWARQALMASYVVSAITKLMESGGMWFRDSQYFALHLIKNKDMKYWETLDESARSMEWLPDFLMQHPLLPQVLFGIGLPLELFAFFGCWNRRLALVFGVALYGFHLCVKQLTLLDFEYNMWLLLILMIHPLWWIVTGIQRLSRRS